MGQNVVEKPHSMSIGQNGGSQSYSKTAFCPTIPFVPPLSISWDTDFLPGYRISRDTSVFRQRFNTTRRILRYRCGRVEKAFFNVAVNGRIGGGFVDAQRQILRVVNLEWRTLYILFSRRPENTHNRATCARWRNFYGIRYLNARRRNLILFVNQPPDPRIANVTAGESTSANSVMKRGGVKLEFARSWDKERVGTVVRAVGRGWFVKDSLASRRRNCC